MKSQQNYAPVTDEVVLSLKKIVNENCIIYNDTEKIEPYSHDEVQAKEYAHHPEVVVMPRSAREIAEIVKLANTRKIPITPRGAGSGLSGGAVPLYGGIVLSMERMNRILEIDLENMVAVVEPGVITNDLNNKVKQEGLFFAGYPMSLETCFIGGNVAENAGGGRAMKYGVTGRYVIGLEIILPTGEIVQYGGKRMKDATGYNMVQMMIGSEGTLGIFSKIILKLLPLPKARIDMLVLFPDVYAALQVTPRITKDLRLIPAGVEFMDRLSLEITCDYLGIREQYANSEAILLIEMDGNSREQVLEECLEIDGICQECGSLETFIAEGPKDQEKIWNVRKHVGEAYNAIGEIMSAEDIVVPPASIVKVIPRLQDLSEKYGVLLPSFGHVGDGNLHVNIIKKPSDDLQRCMSILPMILEELYLLTKELGGTISGEHGIGHKRSKYLPLIMGEAEISAMKRIKSALDPLYILNPGKIFD